MPDMIDRQLGENAYVTVDLPLLHWLVQNTGPEGAFALGGSSVWKASESTVDIRLRVALDVWMLSDSPPPQPPELTRFESLVDAAARDAGFDGIVDAYHRCGPGVLTSADGLFCQRDTVDHALDAEWDVESRLRARLVAWQGEGFQSPPGSAGEAHARGCAALSEGQTCCLDSAHPLFDALVAALAQEEK